MDHNVMTALDIENQSNEDEGDSNTSSSQSLMEDEVATSHSPRQPDNIMQPIHHSPYSPTQHYHEEDEQQQHYITKKPTNLPLLTACYMSALTTGATTYAFSFYSSALKTSLHLSQNQLDTLSSATFCAGILSWIPGMIVDAYGAKFALSMGGLSNTIFLTLYWIIATETIQLNNVHLLVFTLSLFGVIIFMGCALVTGSVFKVIVESCGKGTKGKAVGCAKGYVGVGSGVYVCLFGALFGYGSGGGGGAPPPASSRMLSFLVTTLSSSSTTTTILEGDSTTPQNPELRSLNFLLMAAVLSFVSATLPALLLLPKQTSSSSGTNDNVYKNRRDGTRSIHFRVVYAGLIMLGVWVVGMSLMELYEEEQHGGGENSDNNTNGAIDPSLVNKTLSNVLEDDSTTIITAQHDDGYFTEEDQTSTTTLYARKLLHVTSRRLTSTSSSETHWGSVFFLLLLWWGPALSLLIIPARKEGVDVDEDDSSMIIYSTSDSNNNERSAFNYDDNDDEGDNDNRIDDDNFQPIEEEEREEETFLQDDMPISSRRIKKNGERSSDGSSSDELNPVEPRNFTLLQMLKTCTAWLMAYPCVILVGGGTVMTNNIGQMTESLGFDPATTASSLALFSAAQGAARVCTGIASELALKWELPWYCGCISSGSGGKGVPRPAFLVVASLVSATSHFILAVSTSEVAFTLGVTLSGVAFGMVWPMMVLIIGEVFGNRHVGANYMFFDGFSSAAGTLLLSKFVAQEVYDDHIIETSHGDPGAAQNNTAGEDNFQCIGQACFALSHMIVSMLSLTCVVSSVALIRSTRDVYQRI